MTEVQRRSRNHRRRHLKRGKKTDGEGAAKSSGGKKTDGEGAAKSSGHSVEVSSASVSSNIKSRKRKRGHRNRGKKTDGEAAAKNSGHSVEVSSASVSSNVKSGSKSSSSFLDKWR